MKKKTSIHDIAKQLKVSSTTVSFVINGKAKEKRISVAVEERVLKYIEKIGFQPNMMAKSLRTGKSKIIGLMVENIADPFFSSIARIIEENTYKLGYKIFHSSTDNDTTKSKDLIKVFRERQVDGYIIAPAPGIEDDIQRLVNDGLPVIQFDRYFTSLDTDVVVIDNEEGANTAVKHLFDNGYANIGFVTLDSKQVQMHDRFTGYKKAVTAKKGKPIELKIPYGMDEELATEKMKGFIVANKKMDAILFATNYLAISGLMAIRQLGLRIPEDIGVIGFDDNSHFSLFSPSISAVAQPVQEISDEVIKKLITCLGEKDNKKRRKEITVLKTILKVRESSGNNSVAGIKKIG
ncbi:MAG: substrate-binding domain-containing protein [Ferruginibacter sp.]